MSTWSDPVGTLQAGVSALNYRELTPAEESETFEGDAVKGSDASVAFPVPVNTGPTEAEIGARVEQARELGERNERERLMNEHRCALAQERSRIDAVLADFQNMRRRYFDEVERDVVELAFSITAKILHRESQVNPDLVAALVHLAVERIHTGSSVTVRVPPADTEKYSGYFASASPDMEIRIEGDPSLTAGDCFLDSSVGSAAFGLDSQLREVELGFADLLRRRPE